jgi:SecD/SecF fusion protein
MKQNNNLWKFLFVVFIICWSFYQMYPPTSRDLVKEFTARSENRDATFSNILARVDAMQKAGTNSEFFNLRAAAGTNDIQKYFLINATNETDPTTFILNRIQREGSGKIKLGLDLQGGTAFLVEMDTNALAASVNNGDTNAVARVEDTSGAISQAVEVIRKRVDEFGVAEPVIQPAGANQILIQLPGLSEADKTSAATNIQKAAFLEFRLVKENSQEIIDNNEPIPPGYELLKHAEPAQNGKQQPPEVVIVKKKAESGLSGDIIRNARMGRGNLGEPIIEFMLTDAAGKRFGDVTRETSTAKLTTTARSRAISRRKRRRNSRRCSKIRCARRSRLIIPTTWTRRWARTRFKAASARPSPPSFWFRSSCWSITALPVSRQTSR